MAVAVKTKYKCPPHYWIINNRDYGVCKLCGEERQFIHPWNIYWENLRKKNTQKGRPEHVILPT